MAQQVLIRWNTNRWNWRSKKKIRPFIRLLWKMNGTKNLARDGKLRIFDEQACSPSLVGGLQQQSVYLSTANILLSLTAFLGNSVILVALHKESCLHPPSKLLYGCLATTDLLVGLVCQPLHAAYWMSVSYEHWSLCRFAYDTFSVSAYALCSVSLLTMTAISVETSRLVVRAKVQRTRNFETYLYPCSYLLGVIWFHYVKLPFRSPYSHVVYLFS